MINRINIFEPLKVSEAVVDTQVPQVNRDVTHEKGITRKEELLAELVIGQVRKGIVKKITHFGAFIDLGGVSGFLHIADMSTKWIQHPSDILSLESEIEVIVLDIDREKERVSVGLKQKYSDLWHGEENKFSVGSVVKGQVINIMSYGIFVKLDNITRGLIENREISWTRYITNSSEIVSIEDVISVMVLRIAKGTGKEKMFLSMKRAVANPLKDIAKKYPSGTRIHGIVRKLTEKSAIIEIEYGIDGFLNVSDMSWTKKIEHPSDVVKEGEKIEVVILSVDCENGGIKLGLKQLRDDPWLKEIPDKFKVGDIVSGKVVKLVDYGAFIELNGGVIRLLHISEISKEKVRNPAEVLKVGDVLNVRIIHLDTEAKRLGFSRKSLSGNIEKKGIMLLIKDTMKGIFAKNY